ncbi:MAG: hypothetical protein AMJ81_01820 [Phycisphaerae bacterium SM23_33]|jgi:large subunit ribosomal protein L20|nr:MAG: hypothetical protein AMJ81_01820 [Phycisphaerae bacterium SM23_33]
MPRARKGAARARKHKKILRAARGYIGAASRRYRVAREALLRAGQHAIVGRKLKKREFRQLWITRISAACRRRGLNYSRFMHGLSQNHVSVNRKVLADLAVSDPAAFDDLVAVAAGQKRAEPVEPAAQKVAAEPRPKAAQAQAEPVEVAKEPAAKEEPKPARRRAAKKAPAAAKAREKAKPARKKTAAKPRASKPAPKRPARKKSKGQDDPKG